MSILLADINATCSSLGRHDGNKYYIEEDAIQSLKHLIWILRRDNQDSHEYRRYIGHMKVVQTDLMPMLINYCEDPDLSDVLLRLLVNLTNPTLLFFRDGLPKDGAGRKTYLDLVEISQAYKEAFAFSSAAWRALATRLQKFMEIEVADRMEEQSLVLERVLVLTRNVLQVPANPQHEKRVDNDISVHDQVLWTLHESGMLELILYILSSEYENQYHLHAIEILYLMFREQKVETLADASVQRTAAEKHADEQALIAARKLEKAKTLQRLPPARHSRFGGTYVYKNLKSISDRDLICHQSLERVEQHDFHRNKTKVKSNFRLAKDDSKYERQSAFCIRLFLREFCIEIITSAFNNLVRQVRRVLERSNGADDHGHDQSYLLWAMRFFLEFNRLNGFKLHLASETLSPGSIHWIISQIQHDNEMVQSDKKKKIKWNRRLQLGIQAYREFLMNLQVMELVEDLDTQALLAKLKNNVFYVVEYREIILHLLLSYNEIHYTRSYLRDLIETTNVYMKMMEKFCQGSIVVQTKVRNPKQKHTKKVKPKKLSKEEASAKLENEWDTRVSANLSVVLANEINLPEEEHPVPFDAASEKPIDDQKEDCMLRIHKYLRDEDFERAVLLIRAGRSCWTDTQTFGEQNAAPEDELLLMKDIYLTDLHHDDADDDGAAFWDELENANTDDDDDEDEEEESSAFKEVILHFADFEKRLLNPKVVRACTWSLQGWVQMNYREIKSAVSLLHRIAVNLNTPIMLMQAQLFRIFQQVFDAPQDNRYDELRRLGIFVVRQFVKLAPSNPKIFAELLFFKSHRDCYEIQHGYNGQFGSDERGKNKAWSEEQENELRQLFMENQESPQTDQDVIDWILENLIEKSRTRRGVIKKLKELNLIFKAPTKKSNAQATNKNLFIQEEDDRLRELYEEHRLDKDCLKHIMEVFNKKRSKKAVINRMIQLGLVADESEIEPAKKKRFKDRQENEYDEEHFESLDSDDTRSVDGFRKPTNRTNISKYQIDNRMANSLRLELEESLKDGIEWIIDSLNEAADDFEEPSEDPDDAIPIVPFSEAQKLALENLEFQKLMKCVNLCEPQEQETYWKIPANMMPEQLRQRAKILAGENVEQPEPNHGDSDEDDDGMGLFDRLRARHDNIIYNKSDNEEEQSTVLNNLKNNKKKTKKVGKPNTKIINQLLCIVDEDHSNALKWIAATLKDKARNKTKSGVIDEMLLVPSGDDQKRAMADNNFQKILAGLNIQRPDGEESFWYIPGTLNSKDLVSRAKLLDISENAKDGSSGEEAELIIKRKKPKSSNHDNDLEINTQQLRERLAELEDSSDNDEQNLSSTKRIDKVFDSSDEDNDNNIASTAHCDDTESRKPGKRERSNDSPDENEMNATNNQLKRIRRIADSSDDE